jgi:succinate dehydrogenase/fumarate reductase flavoprotein subunit
MKIERVETDVLCVGGGIAGLMAAIRASELGAKVVVAEKGVTKYSGSARAGNDHFWCYIPEIHGSDVDLIIRESRITQKGPVMAMLGTAFLRTWLKKTLDIIKLWDEWGIPMRTNGRWELSGHAFPGRSVTHLKYKGFNQKPVLTEQALKRGARIMDRTMVFDLLVDGDGIRERDPGHRNHWQGISECGSRTHGQQYPPLYTHRRRSCDGLAGRRRSSQYGDDQSSCRD